MKLCHHPISTTSKHAAGLVRRQVTPGRRLLGRPLPNFMRSRTPFLLATLAVSNLMLVGCGGGEINDLPSVAQSARQTAAATVLLEGCVVDSQWMGAARAAVHLRTEDGRPLGTALTNERGVFVLAVPANSNMVMNTEWGATGGLTLKTGSGSLSVAGCLQASA
jgi:hypothetical protein